MCTFNGKFPQKSFEGISVDCFDQNNLDSKYYFLSHFHGDHMKGLGSPQFQNYFKENKDARLYCSGITRSLIKKSNLIDLSMDKVLAIELYHEIYLQNDDIVIRILPMRAGHCPGSMMFLFISYEAKILFTGDFRMNLNDIKLIRHLHDSDGKPLELDMIYIDSTFAAIDYSEFPSREESLDIIVKIIENCYKNEPDKIFIIEQPANIGQEFLMMGLAKALKKKVHVDNDFCFHHTSAIDELSTVVTSEWEDTNIHFCFRRSCEFCSTKRKEEKDKIVYIKPTAMIFKRYPQTFIYNLNQVTKRWRVCYSSHASLNELWHMVDYLKPKALCPITAKSEEESQKMIGLMTMAFEPKFWEVKKKPVRVEGPNDFMAEMRIPYTVYKNKD